jgi:hypothetical protein
LANPEGRGQWQLPRLLNRLGDEIRLIGEVEVLDITFHAEVTNDGSRPHFVLLGVVITAAARRTS